MSVAATKKAKALTSHSPRRLLLKTTQPDQGKDCWRGKLKLGLRMVSPFSNIKVIHKTKAGIKALNGLQQVLNT